MKNENELRFRGSYTVEAALLMSVILMVLFLVLQMDLMLTDQTRMSALLAEDCTYGPEEEQERNRWFAGEEQGFFYLEADRVRRYAASGKITSAYPSAEVLMGYGHRVDPAQEICRKDRDPVKYIRAIAAIAGGKGG